MTKIFKIIGKRVDELSADFLNDSIDRGVVYNNAEELLALINQKIGFFNRMDWAEGRDGLTDYKRYCEMVIRHISTGS